MYLSDFLIWLNDIRKYIRLAVIFHLLFKVPSVACTHLYEPPPECPEDEICSYTWMCQNLEGDPGGTPVSLGSFLSNRSSLYLFHSLKSSYYGYISKISWYSSCKGIIRLGVWDSGDSENSTYVLMDKLELSFNSFRNGQKHVWEHKPDAKTRLSVRPGSVLGVHFGARDPPSTLSCLEVQHVKKSNVDPVNSYSAVFGLEYKDPLSAVQLNNEKPFIPFKKAILEGIEKTAFHIPERSGGMLVSLVASVTCHCSVNCILGLCNPKTGKCTFGCSPGYAGERCDETCSNGFYGKNCTERCSSYCLGSSCHSVHGHCFECTMLHYGLEEGCVNECGQCTNGTGCNSTTGECLEGCLGGFVKPRCMECSAGFYSEDCSKKCGKCYGNHTCSIFDGSCPVGCENGLQPPLCAGPCKPGYFGFQCSIRCGSCRSDVICDPFTGLCPEGKCRMGYQTPQCKILGTSNGLEGDSLYCPPAPKIRLTSFLGINRSILLVCHPYVIIAGLTLIQLFQFLQSFPV